MYTARNIYTPDPGVQRSPYIFEDSAVQPRSFPDYSLSKFINGKEGCLFDVVSVQWELYARYICICIAESG